MGGVHWKDVFIYMIIIIIIPPLLREILSEHMSYKYILFPFHFGMFVLYTSSQGTLVVDLVVLKHDLHIFILCA